MGQHRTLLLILLGVGIVLALIVVFLIEPGWAYQVEGTGFGASHSPPNNPKAPVNYYPKKTLWDWLQLLVIPATIAGVGIWFNHMEKAREQKIAKENRDSDQKIAEDNRAADKNLADARLYDAAFDSYSSYIFEKLSTIKNDKDEKELALVRTRTVLRRLDGKRKGMVVRLLLELNLIRVLTLRG
jgi:hypothetical protein